MDIMYEEIIELKKEEFRALLEDLITEIFEDTLQYVIDMLGVLRNDASVDKDRDSFLKMLLKGVEPIISSYPMKIRPL